MKKCRYVSVTGVMALLVALGTGVEEVKANQTVQVRLVRATEYDKGDLYCDPGTLAGKTSTKLRLPQSEAVVIDQNRIGDVALDPAYFQEGCLVYETQTRRLFVGTKGGTDVIDRTAAIATAKKKNLPQVFKDALVFDFYFPKPIVDNEYTHCWVFPHQGEKEFWRLDKESQELRLTPKFWLSFLQPKYDSATDEAEKHRLRVMIDRLKKIR